MSNLRLGDFALQLVVAFQSWHSAAGEPAGTYFAGSPQRHGGDELTIRSSWPGGTPGGIVASGGRSLIAASSVGVRGSRRAARSAPGLP